VPTEHLASCRLPTGHGSLALHVFGRTDGTEEVEEVVAAVHAAGPPPAAPPLVRAHSACLTGDLLGSLRCDCGQQLSAALDLIAAEDHGILLYLIGHEGRGIGLANKIRAYALQEEGRDTVEANQDLGLPVDARGYSAAVAALRWLGVDRIRLATNNPVKIAAFARAGIAVTRVPLGGFVTPYNAGYLQAKDRVLGHLQSLGRPS
jgi:GTP cyclohydrolase II/3,4-dihydroxy 2-butanone 4-phosphate synthase/GTP cyclohydrolase II